MSINTFMLIYITESLRHQCIKIAVQNNSHELEQFTIDATVQFSMVIIKKLCQENKSQIKKWCQKT